MNGIINVYKEAGWTSHDVVAKLRGILKMKKIGHTGTLDPDATGVLPVCLGKATKLCELLAGEDKTYEAVLRLGITTDTQDISGTVIKETNPAVTEKEAISCIRSFEREYMQVPPMYSALKINGKKLYELAREGKTVERKARPVHFYRIEILKTDLPEIRFSVTCSKGTYIRTLCHDIGQVVGCGAAMCSLRRTMAAGFTLEDAVSLETVLSAPNPAALLRGTDTLFAHRPQIRLRPRAAREVRNGTTLSIPGLADGEYRVYGPEGEFLALSRCEGGRLTTIKSFFEV